MDSISWAVSSLGSSPIAMFRVQQQSDNSAPSLDASFKPKPEAETAKDMDGRVKEKRVRQGGAGCPFCTDS